MKASELLNLLVRASKTTNGQKKTLKIAKFKKFKWPPFKILPSDLITDA